MGARVVIVIALHAGPLARHDGDRDGGIGAAVAAGKTIGRHQHETDLAARRACAGASGDALNLKRRRFGCKRALGQRLGRDLGLVVKIEVRGFAGKPGALCKAGIGVFGRDGGHGERALDQGVDIAVVIGGNACDLRPAEHAQRKAPVLGRLGVFALCLAHRDAVRGALRDDHIGRIGALLLRDVENLRRGVDQLIGNP